ncbi:MAG: LPS assembly protein LptD, partial [Rhodocyclaceae bacterium]
AFLSAQRMSGTTEREAIAEGDAQLRKIGTVVDADRMTYWPIDDELEAVGNVRLEQGEDWMSGPKMRLKLEEQVGFFEQPTYFLRRESVVASDPWLNLQSGMASAGSVPLRKTTEGRGQAERIDFEGVNQIRLTDATYTTCKPDNDSWYASAHDLKLDYDREVADGSDATVYFKGVPILYSPWMSFSLNNNRKSGLLAPTFGSTSNSGLELTLPYYWNIAPHMDATIAPRLLGKRGMQVGSEFRYLGETYSGEARAEVLPNDKMANRDRYAYSLRHSQNLGNGFSGAINYSKVSDDTYFTDLSSRMVNTSQTQLLQQGVLNYGAGWWNATANMQTYQTLQPDRNHPVAEPYRLKPQLTLNARQPDLYRTDSSFFGQFTSFAHPTAIEARRTVLYPQVALPIETPGWYIKPKIGLHATYYALNRQTVGTPDSLDRTLPIFSIDSGMTFERPSNWFGADYTQTLEPRLFYLNVPYRDQSNIPVFDSGLADFNFAQIFSENQFVGQDRINDANQLTTALTSRLIDPASGREILRAMIGQRYYFRNQQVVLPGSGQRVWDRSNFLAAFSRQVAPKIYA